MKISGKSLVLLAFLFFPLNAYSKDAVLDVYSEIGKDFIEKSILYIDAYTKCLERDLKGSCAIDKNMRNIKYINSFKASSDDLKRIYKTIYNAEKITPLVNEKSLNFYRQDFFFGAIELTYKIAGEIAAAQKECGDVKKSEAIKSDALYFLQYVIDRLQYDYMMSRSDESKFYLNKKYELQSNYINIYKNIENKRKYESKNECEKYISYGESIFDKTHNAFMLDKKYAIDTAAVLYALHYAAAIYILEEDEKSDVK